MKTKPLSVSRRARRVHLTALAVALGALANVPSCGHGGGRQPPAGGGDGGDAPQPPGQRRDGGPPGGGGDAAPGDGGLEPPRLSDKTYYVSPTGSDDHAGTKEAPFRTIQRAANVMHPGDTCVIRAGVYRETVRPVRSGFENAPLTFRSHPGEVAVISGTEPITGWKASDDPTLPNVFQAPVPALFVSTMNQADQVFVDGKMVHLARWPNYGEKLSDPAKATLTRFVSKTRDKATNLTTGVFEDDELPAQPDGHYVGMEIFLQPNKDAWSWAFTGKITAHAGKSLTLASRNDSGQTGKTQVYAVGSRYYLFNDRRLLDADDEWWLDRAAKVLYLRVADPAKRAVEIKARDYAFDLDKRSHVVIKDLSLFAATITMDRGAGGDAIPYKEDGSARYPWRGEKVPPADSTNVVVEGIRAKYLNHFTDMSGHFYLQWGQGTGIVLSGRRHVIRDSVIQATAGNGILLLGEGHRALNNHVEDAAYTGLDCAGISTGGAARSVDHEIGHNTVTRTGRSCVTLRNLVNSDPAKLVARVHHNDLSHCMLQDEDGGGVYTFGIDGLWTRIDHNWVHDIEGFANGGLYVDFGKNYIMDHNVVWNVEWGILLQGAFERQGMPTANNTLVYHNTLAVKSTSGAPYGPFGFAGAKTTNVGTVLQNNLVHLVGPAPGFKLMSEGYAAAEKIGNVLWDGKPGSATDPAYANAAGGDFTLKATSAAKDKGTAVPEYVRDGATVPPFNDPAVGPPDLGAYEIGGERWTAGATVKPAP